MKFFKLFEPSGSKDSRINAGFISFKTYFLLFSLLGYFNLFRLIIENTYLRQGINAAVVRQATLVVIVYLLFASALTMIFIGFVINKAWNRPMRLLGNAARKIAQGDFSVHLAPRRKDGKKDFVEVMFDDFNTMAKELAGIETLKTEFIANVSHEIKTPLTVIQNCALALQNGDLPVDRRREYTQTILEAAQKLSALTSNILKLNKLENQEIIPESGAFDLGEQLRRCALAFEELWERKNIAFDADLDELLVPCDETILEIVWNNLLSNAVKFTPPGGVIALTAKAENGLAVVTVKNSGPGMDRETKNRIFDKFYQGDTSHAQEGNGLGLALVKRAVELLGGTVTVDSEPGQGSVFTVQLKLPPPHGTDTQDIGRSTKR
ncbi:MAG: HAMP domain-containing histidine kinase [Treponema sp.]|jgi:signal transduction histidine kinase|nr:HAMP domain-containing histidine kinase [Treponema sp.]